MDFSQKKVLFINANLIWSGKRVWKTTPYAALILTSLLKNEFDFQLIDANGENLTEEECKSRIKAIAPDIVLVSALSVEYYQLYHKTVAMVKEACPDAVTVMGGVYPTVLGEEVIKDPHIDYIFIGHAEERVVEFLQMILNRDIKGLDQCPGIGYKDSTGKVVIHPVTSFIVDVKKVAKMDYSLIDLQPYLTQDVFDFHFNSEKPTACIITSFGCLYNCVFCASRTICGKGIAFRPLEDVIEEIEYLISKYHIEGLTFSDELLLANRERSLTLFQTMIDRNYNLTWKIAALSAWNLDDKLLELMKQSGCAHVNISIESGRQETLDKIIRKPLRLSIVPEIIKKCKELGFTVSASFVIGFPGEKWDDIRETFRFAESIELDVAYFHIATPQPKTDLYEIAKEQGLLPDDFSFFDPKFFGFGQGFITTEEFTPRELMILRAFEYDRINFSTPEKIEKLAKMYLTTVEKLNEHRRETRRKLGVHF